MVGRRCVTSGRNLSFIREVALWPRSVVLTEPGVASSACRATPESSVENPPPAVGRRCRRAHARRLPDGRAGGSSGPEALRGATAEIAVPAPVASAVPDAVSAPDRGRPPVVVPVRELGERRRPDVLITRAEPLPAESITELAALAPEGGAVTFRAGIVRVGDKDVRAVGVDPSTFRAFTAEGTAEATAVWESIARGEVVVSHEAGQALALTLGQAVPVAAPGTAPPGRG